MRDFLIKEIHRYLTSLGFSESNSAICAQYGYEFYERSICNSRDPFKDSCDHAGAKAQMAQPKIKYKSPKAKSKPRTKKPQDAFNFGE